MRFFPAFLLSLFFYGLNAQHVPKKGLHNEFSLNVFNGLFLKAIDISYEHLIKANNGIGVTYFYNFKDDNQSTLEDLFDFYYREEYAITPYYRYYPINRHGSGFFLEGFGMYNKQRYHKKLNDDDTADDRLRDSLYLGKTSKNVAIGVSVGGKFMHKDKFFLKIYAGLGRNIYMENNKVAYGLIRRLGVSFGFRF